MVMVSLNPHQTIQDLFIDTGVNSMSTSSNRPSTMATAGNSDSNSTVVWPSDDTNKKVRKPYTITKSRESWTDEEHEKFLEALQLFDRDWKKIEAFVGSKTVIQIRSHAQKYFLKVQKSGTGEHVPPPRPKRKAAHPYPQKASKNAPTMPQVTQPFQSFGALVEAGYIFSPDSASLPGNAICNPHVPYWTGNTMSPANMSTVIKDEMGVTRQNMIHNCCSSSSNESTQRRRPTGETNDQGKENVLIPERVIPDFSQVYSFIGSVFDPNASGHLQKLKKMDPINVETVLLLMKNLTVNLLNPEFEDHRKMICSHGDDAGKIKPSSFPHISKPENAIPSV